MRQLSCAWVLVFAGYLCLRVCMVESQPGMGPVAAMQ